MSIDGVTGPVVEELFVWFHRVNGDHINWAYTFNKYLGYMQNEVQKPQRVEQSVT